MFVWLKFAEFVLLRFLFWHLESLIIIIMTLFYEEHTVGKTNLPFDLKINVGHSDLCFMVQWFLSYMLMTIWYMKVLDIIVPNDA